MGRFLASQLAGPSGWFGRVVMSRVLNRGNAELIDAAVAALEVKPGQTILDIGFGGGASFALALNRGAQRIIGVDPSEDSVAFASRVHASLLSRGILELKSGKAENLPLESKSCHAVVSTNTVYFWPAPEDAFREIRRVLVPGGRLVLGFSGEEKLRGFSVITQHGFHFHKTEEIAAKARSAGFDVRLEALHGKNTEGDFLLLAV